MPAERLTKTFATLVDPARRVILKRLSEYLDQLQAREKHHDETE